MTSIRNFILVCTLALCALAASGQETITRTLLMNAGAYSSSVLYSLSDVVVSSGVYYISLVANNLNNTPVSSPSDWAALGSGSSGMVYPSAGIPCSTGSAWCSSYGTQGSGSVLLGTSPVGTAAYQNTSYFQTALGYTPLNPANNLSDVASVSAARSSLGLGSAALQATSYFDLSGAASTAQTNAETYASNASNLSSGTVALARLPTSIPNANLLYPSMTVNGVTCTLGGSCSPANAPPLDIRFYSAAVSDGGTAYTAALTRYDNNQPQVGSVAPATSSVAYMAFQATPTLPQYAEMTISAPPYWTGTSITIDFSSAATSGNVIWDVQAVCVPTDTAFTSPYSPSFPTATQSTTTVSSTQYGLVTTAVLSNIIGPGIGSCPSSPTTPTKVTYRIYRDASDTASGNANLLGITLLTSRSQ